MSDRVRELLQVPAKDVYFSVASLWEICIKHSLGRLSYSAKVVSEAMKTSGFQRLAITDEHLERLVQLPPYHRDPFDRLLVAQADAEPLKLVTSDKFLACYGSSVVVV